MRSLYAKIVLWSLIVLALSGSAFVLISSPMLSHGRPGLGTRMNSFMFEQIVATYETSGPEGLKVVLDRADRIIGGKRHLADARSRDLISGEDLSGQFQKIREWGVPNQVDGRHMSARASADGRYRMLTLGGPAVDAANSVPYYLVVMAAVALLSWLLASRIVSPLRKVAAIIDNFGSGDLNARVQHRRHDEIGSLGDSFNQMADRLRTLLVAERRLLQDVSHELRSPLARLSFAARLARTAPDRDAAIDRIKAEIDRLTELVSSLIEVTRAEGDPTERRQEVIDINRLLERVVGDCQLDAQSKQCRISYTSHSSLACPGNEELLHRALENITRNAIRYAPSGTDVEIELCVSGSEAAVKVRDYGPGVPEEKLARIFDPFFRVEASRDSTEGGVGLGLAIARRAVNVHGGTLTAENANPGLLVVMRIPFSTPNAGSGLAKTEMEKSRI